MSPRRRNATDSDILAMLKDGHSNQRISRELRCDKHRVARLRRQYGIPHVVLQPLTLEQKWATYTRPVDGGHLEWTGPRGTSSNTPVMRYKEAGYSPAAIAFEQKHGRPPQGYVKAECDYPHCVAPDHVNDEAGRRQARLQERAARGLRDIPTECVRGHELAEHVKFEPDGTAYCGMCKVLDKRAQRAGITPSAGRRRMSLEERFQRHTEPVSGGHVRWTGSTSHGTPVVRQGSSTHSAYRVAFRLEYGREPVGPVTSGCGMPSCVAGAHLEDRPMRQRTNDLFTAIFGETA